jgi:acyl carrier protein
VNTSDLIRRFVLEELLGSPSVTVDPLAAGMLDSLAIEQLAAFIEDDLGVVIEDDDMRADNFASLQAVTALVERRRPPPAAP